MSTCTVREIEVTIQCPICIGMGRIYATPETPNMTPNCSDSGGLQGIDCPNCDGVGTMDS